MSLIGFQLTERPGLVLAVTAVYAADATTIGISIARSGFVTELRRMRMMIALDFELCSLNKGLSVVPLTH